MEASCNGEIAFRFTPCAGRFGEAMLPGEDIPGITMENIWSFPSEEEKNHAGGRNFPPEKKAMLFFSFVKTGKEASGGGALCASCLRGDPFLYCSFVPSVFSLERSRSFADGLRDKRKGG